MSPDDLFHHLQLSSVFAPPPDDAGLFEWINEELPVDDVCGDDVNIVRRDI
jgi:hypothetical protein